MSSTHPIHFAARRCTASLFLAIAALVVALGCGSSDGGDPGAASGAGTGVGGAGNVDGGAADGSAGGSGVATGGAAGSSVGSGGSTGSTCTPTTCAAVGVACGSIPDKCGGFLQCGICAAGKV